jgi:uncharacterized membrane protein YgcG
MFSHVMTAHESNWFGAIMMIFERGGGGGGRGRGGGGGGGGGAMSGGEGVE